MNSESSSPVEIFRSEFSGKTACVTGGSSGIGREIVHTLAGLGATVHFCGRHEDAGRATVEACAGGRAYFSRVDVTDPAALQQWIRTVDPLDYLINNVADDHRVPFDELDAAVFDAAVAVNLRSHYLAALAALPALRRGVGKAIVNVGTSNYMRPEPDCLLYNVAKSGIVGLTHALARQLGPERIRVNTFTPGWIATPKQLAHHMTPEAQTVLKQEQALPVILKESDVMGPLLFLLSRCAGAVTGQNLLAEAGKVML